MTDRKRTGIAVKPATVRRLREAIAGLCVAIENGTVEDIRDGVDAKNPATLPITYDRFINYLLDRRDAYATARAIRNKRRTGKKGRGAE